MATNLSEYLSERPAGGFRPVPHYSAAGDFVTFHFRDGRSYAERVDELLTVYRSVDTKELVGCKIKGMRGILEQAGRFGVLAEGGEVRLGLFFFVGSARAMDDSMKELYGQLAEAAKDALLPLGRPSSAA